MALECNIGETGKAARLRLGLLGVAGGVALGIITSVGLLPSLAWWGVLGSIAGGSFAIWEARAGWCIVRAMGFKTPV